MDTRPDVALVSLYPRSGRHHAGRSGVASYTSNLARALSDLGVGVAVVAQHETGEPTVRREANVHVHRAFRRGPRALMDAARTAIDTNAPVVHLQFETFLYGGPGALLALVPALTALKRARRRVVVTMHQVVDPTTVDADFVRLHRVRAPGSVARIGIDGLQRAIRRLADRVIVHEAAFTEIIEGAVVVPHGVEILSPADRSLARERLHLDDAPTAMCFGFVAPYKGLEAVLDAARMHRDDWRLVVAGGAHPRQSGSSYPDELRERWGDTARFTGYVDECAVPDWFSAVDVALFPYPRPFASSGALALALAYSTPVLMSPSLSRTVCAPGALTMPDDPHGLGAAVAESLNDPLRFARLRGASRAMRAGRTWPEIAARHLQAYREVSDADRPAGRSLRAG